MANIGQMIEETLAIRMKNWRGFHDSLRYLIKQVNAALAVSPNWAKKSVAILLVKRSFSGEPNTNNPTTSFSTRNGNIAIEAIGASIQVAASKSLFVPQNGAFKLRANNLIASLVGLANQV